MSAGDVELTPTDDDSDVQIILHLMSELRARSDGAIINVAQCRNATRRLAVVSDVLKRVPYPQPNVHLVCIFRSAVALVEAMGGSEWTQWAQLHLHCAPLFATLRERLRRVWQLLPSESWSAEDRTARDDDLLASPAHGIEPFETGNPEVATIQAARHRYAPWRLHCQELKEVAVRESTHGTTSSVARFRLFFGYSLGARAVVVKEIGGVLLTPVTLESFVLDASRRALWMHPQLITTYGAFTERYDEHGMPYNCVGLVMADVSSTHTTLHQLLFSDGHRFSLHEAVHATLQIVEGLAYALMDEAEVSAEVSRAWCSVSPSNVFVRKGSSPPSVALSPRLFIEDGPVSRWDVPATATSVLGYTAAQLLLTMTTGRPPYPSISTQWHLRELHAFSRAAKVPSGGPYPRGFFVPAGAHPTLKKFLDEALRCGHGEGAWGIEGLRAALRGLLDLPDEVTATAEEATEVSEYGDDVSAYNIPWLV